MNFAPILTAGPAIQMHIAGALSALLLGAGIFLLPKGTPWHRRLGWAYVAAMLLAAVSSLWIQRDGRFSWIHLLTLLSFYMLAVALIKIRRGLVQAHRKTMIGLYLGGPIIAGLFTLVPGRIMGRVVFGW